MYRMQLEQAAIAKFGSRQAFEDERARRQGKRVARAEAKAAAASPTTSMGLAGRQGGAGQGLARGLEPVCSSCRDR